MLNMSGVHLLLLLGVAWHSAAQDDDFLYGTFPDDFLWGTSTSAYQIEGGWNADGKGEHIWDRWSHEGNRVSKNATGDVACDSYNKIADDVKILKDLKVMFYRFSISWSRIYPLGEGAVNEAGIAYYNRLIDSLLAEGIEPMATLYHWDLPSALQDKYGGWLNESIIPAYVQYARTCFERFGDRVKWWLTFNEPWVVTYLGYEIGVFAPGIYQPGTGAYTAAHTIIKAHAHTWHTYNDEFRPSQNGKISITLDSDWKEPYNDSSENVAAAERANQFKLGWYAHPLFVNGDYPQLMKDQVAKKSAEQNFSRTRLPEFTEEEKKYIVGTWDYFGLNHYTTQLIIDNTGPSSPGYSQDQETIEFRDPAWPGACSSWLKSVPWGFRKLLNFIKDNYNNPPVVVTENGYSDCTGTLQDQDRVDFYTNYTNAMLKAIKEDNCSVIAYTAWSLMDNFEWNSGYDEKFGMHYVDFNDPSLPRTRKASADFYTQLIENNGFIEPTTRSVGPVSRAMWPSFISTLLALIYVLC